MIYLYAVTELAPQGFRGLGLDGTPVLTLACGSVHLAYSVHESGFEPPVVPEALWAHEGIVDELLEGGPVVPFRYGTTLPDRAAAEAYLAREQDQFTRTLAALRGRVELAVRLAVPESAESTAEEGSASDDGSASDSGSAYLSARVSERRAHDEVLAPLASLAVARRQRDGGSARMIRASYLVASDDVERFASVVRRLQESHPELTLSCTGPWAPYSFVEEGA